MSLLLALLASVSIGAAPVTGTSVCVDINTASFVDLQRIIHIGPKRAQQIIQLRQARPFRSVDELVRVRGIARGRLADIKEQGLACVGGASAGNQPTRPRHDASGITFSACFGSSTSTPVSA